ncbi:MAG: cation-transporting P-type ATPase [Chloroflexi bacterium]|nr:cation-transporting P-type ATPase [Chloroflexota bacterium]
MSGTSIDRLEPGQVLAAMDTPASGLTAEVAVARLLQHGRNELHEARHPPLSRRLLANFTHLMASLLWVAGGMAFVAGMAQLGVAVWLVVLLNGAFSFWQEYKAERATEALRKLLPVYARVLRDGHEERIAAEELVPGDIMLLAEGDAISADGRLIQAFELRVDQSTLSGESHPVRKDADAVVGTDLALAELPNLVFAGTAVVGGTGRAVVFAVGMETEFGKIAALTQSMGTQLSPLQKEIQVVTRLVSIFAVGAGLLFFALSTWMAGMELLEAFIFAMGMIVAFVPEGLLPTVTLALAMGVQRMARRNAIVKRLSSVETLGCTSVICTDKTGTLTQNEMTVRQIWVGGRTYGVTGAGYAPEGALQEEPGEEPGLGAELCAGDLAACLVAAVRCNNARLIAPGEGTERQPGWQILGDPTEAALLVVACKAGIDLAAVATAWPLVRELPFESQRRRMSTIHRELSTRQVAGEGGERAFVKGAPSEILALSSHVRLGGQVLPLDSLWRQKAMEANDRMARAGMRVLAVAERQLPVGFDDFRAEAVEQDLVLLGLLGMLDPPRPEVAQAVATCRSAGIRTIMVTGDYGLTAESIARRIGIVVRPLPRLVTGADLDGMDASALAEALQEEVIFARVSPDHKLRIVAALQALGHVVAVTGDGVNDAPALKQADIGVAMGKGGTDVAKEAADLILTDDNFASIVAAVEEGRAVYANIRKFTSYILTSNVPEAVPFVAFAFSGGRIPLAINIMQVLSIDVGTDIVPALALGMEPPEPGLMARPPRSRSEHLVDRPLLVRAYAIQGMVQGLATMASFYGYFWTQGHWGQWLDLPDTGPIYFAAAAMALGAVICGQIGNLFAHRSQTVSVARIPLFHNRLIWIGVGVELLLLLAMIHVPFLQPIFGMAPFDWPYWFFLLAWVPVVLGVDELRKLLAARLGRGGLVRDGGSL